MVLEYLFHHLLRTSYKETKFLGLDSYKVENKNTYASMRDALRPVVIAVG